MMAKIIGRGPLADNCHPPTWLYLALSSQRISDKTISAHGMYDSTRQRAQPQVSALLREFGWMIERCPALGGPVSDDTVTHHE
jgi:hypothetical protein